MPCYHPLQAYRFNFNGKNQIEFLKRDRSPDLNRQLYGKDYLQLPCGKCIGCRLERSRQWATRIMHEAQMHSDNVFITLTYSEENLPENCSLNYKDFQDFMKRLRFHFAPQKIRFFMCGEYGGKKGRPHYHACLFNCNFNDKQIIKKNSQGQVLYTSQTLEKLWGKGIVSIGELTFESAAYVARYIMKKITGDQAEEHYSAFVDKDTGELISDKPRVPEFCRMSNRDGIGSDWLTTFKLDVYPHDTIITRGHMCKPPRYYDKKLEVDDPVMHKCIKEFRELRAEEKSKRCGYDDSPERMNVKEKVKLAAIRSLKRNLEKEI